MRSNQGPSRRLARVRSLACLVVVACAISSCGSAPPAERQPTRVADLERLAGRKVVVMKPDIDLYVIRSGGLPELEADWTRAARTYVVEALSQRLKTMKLEVFSAEEIDTKRAWEPLALQVVRLQSAVAEAILKNHYERFDRLPTTEGRFDWSLGTEAEVLAQRYQADYAFFVGFHENYPSDDLIRSDLGQISRISAVMSLYRRGYASLVELKSGRVVWFAERDRQSPGLRTDYETSTTIRELLMSFPG